MSMITEQCDRLRTLADIAKDIADNSTDTVKTLREAADTIELLAEKVRPRSGHWRAVYQGDCIINYRCSECEFGNTFGKNTYRMNYCPNCGAKMEEEE